MLKRDDYSKLSKEEFRMFLNRAKAKGMSHQKAYDKVKEICNQIVAPNFKDGNRMPKTRNEMIEQFYADIENS